MNKTLNLAAALMLVSALFMSADPGEAKEQENQESGQNPQREHVSLVKTLPEKISRFQFDSGYHFQYPDAVRGIYVTGHSTGVKSLIN